MKNRFRIGPGAASLVLMVVVVTMCVMEMLTLISARNDDRLTGRSLLMTEELYALNAAGERTYAELDALMVRAAAESTDDADYLKHLEELLPQKAVLDGNVIRWSESGETRTLVCAVSVNGLRETKRSRWEEHIVASGREAGSPGEGEAQSALADAAARAQADYDLIAGAVTSLREKNADRKSLEKALTEALPEGFLVKDGRVSWTVSENGNELLLCEVALPESGDMDPIRWVKCERADEKE